MRTRGIASDVRDFGAVGDGVTDDFAAIQAAINYVSHKGGGAVIFPSFGRYLITQTLHSNAPVLLKADVYGNITDNTNGDLTSGPTIIWGGQAGPNAYMFQQSPPAAGRIIWGGGSEGIEWNGNDIAEVAVHFDNSRYAIFDGKIRQVRFAGLIINSNSGQPYKFSQNNEIRRLEFIYGSVLACENADGVIIEGNGIIGSGNVPSTQHYIGHISGLVKNGTMLKIIDSDNNHIESIQAAVVGTGWAVKLINPGYGITSHVGFADSNLFLYAVGPISIDQGLYTNTFLHIAAETSRIQLINDAKWHGEIVDYVAPFRAYQSHKYQLRKKIEIPSSSLALTNLAVIKELSFIWGCPVLPDGVGSNTPRATAILPPQYDLPDGILEGIEVYYCSSAGSSGQAYRIQILASSAPLGFLGAGVIATPSFSAWISVPGATIREPTLQVVNFSPPLTHTAGSLIAVSIRRDPSNAADTAGDDFVILGLRVLYKGDGPVAGNFDVPQW